MALVPWARREALAGDHLPYRTLLDENVLLLRDGSAMISLLLPGTIDADAGSAGSMLQAAARETQLRGALAAGYALYHHVIRRRVRIEPGGAFDDPLSAHIDARWKSRLAAGPLFVNDSFVTLLAPPARVAGAWPHRLFRQRSARPEEVETGNLEALRAVAAALIESFAPDGARLLGEYMGADGPCSEVLELLSALYNGEMRPVRRPAGGADVGAMLPYRRTSFGLDALELRDAGGAAFASLLGIKHLPGGGTGLSGALLHLPCEMVLTESLVPGAGPAAPAVRQLSVMVRAQRLDLLDEGTAHCAAALADAGAIAVREDVGLEPGFWSQFPGNAAYAIRRTPLTEEALARFAAPHPVPLGKPAGNHWGEAVSLLPTVDSTPFFFNFHYADLGHFTIVGPPGSGRTVALQFLAAQAQRNSPRTVLFDRDGAAEIFVRGSGGSYLRIAPGKPPPLNPLALPDTPDNRAFLRAWLGVLLAVDDAQDEAIVADALAAMFAGSPPPRRMTQLREHLAGANEPRALELARRLDRWAGSGEHAWLFDHGEDRLDLSARVLGFDLSPLSGSPQARLAAQMYLLHRIGALLDGDPAMVLFDDGPHAPDGRAFAAPVRDWLRSLRLNNAVAGFVLQPGDDALGSPVAAAIAEQCATAIFMPDPRARAEDYCGLFGLSAAELDVVRSLPRHGRCCLVRRADGPVVVRLDLTGLPGVLTVLAGRADAVRRLDALRAQRGDAPAAWFEDLTGEPWPGEPETADDIRLRAAAE